jgi:hypothetical protein
MQEVQLDMAFKRKSHRSKVSNSKAPHQQLPQTSSKQKYRSKFEAGIAANLNKNKVAFSYESLELDYILSCCYKPDFILNNGVIIETKGFLSKEDRRKMVAVKAANPSLDIRFCFQNAKTKLSRGKKRSLSYGQWATKNGFLWCDKTIPADWY